MNSANKQDNYMTKIRSLLRRTSLLTLALALFGGWVIGDLVLFAGSANAAQITARKLTISSSANGSINVGNPGEGGNGARAKYTFSFTVPTTGNIGSVLFQICTTPLPGTTCTSPTGFTAANVTAVTTTGTGFSSGFTVNTSTVLTGAPYNCTGASPGRTNCIAISRTAASVTSGAAVTAEFGASGSNYVTNPTTDNQAFFVRMTTYSDNAFATPVDQGSVANSTAQQIDITAKVQETLNFSVGSTVTTPGASCTAFSDSGALALGDLTEGTLSFQQAYDAHSYFRLSTNANGGTVVYYSGDTLKSGSNSIAAAGTTQPTPSTAVASATGTSQFGLAVDSSDTQSGDGHSFTSLAATAPYAAGNGTITNGGTALFAFAPSSVTTPVQIASASGTVTCDTGSVRYLGNISTTTPPGIYTTSITYLAAPTY
jgi:hypothetical protein